MRILLLVAVTLPILFAVSLTVPSAHAAGTLYVSPATMAAQPVGTMLTYQVKVVSMDSFNGWDVSVVTNSSVLDPVSITVTGDLFDINFSSPVIEVVNCVDGVGTGCSVDDGPGIAHSSAVSGVSATSGSSGLLFTITYVVVNPGYSFLTIPLGLDLLFTVAHSTSGGVYGNPPSNLPVADFTFSPSTPMAGDNVTFDASSSIDPNPGAMIVRYSWTIRPFSGGLAVFNTTSEPIMVHHFGAADVGNFYVTLVVKDSLGLVSRPTVQLVDLVDFTITATSPADFNTGASVSARSSTGNSTVTIIPLRGFAGPITLTTLTTPATGLTPNCPTGLTITGTTAVIVTCSPTSSTPGTYLVTIIGSGGGITHTATFVSHVGDFSISVVSPIDFKAGDSGATIPVTLSSSFNFAGNITLTSLVSPTVGLAVTCPTSAVKLAPNATASASCALSSTTAGTYFVTINGTGSPGTVPHSALAVVHVSEFTLSVGPSMSFNSGASGSSTTITVTPLTGFAGLVNISTSTSPTAGLTVSCPTSLTVLTTTPVTGTCTFSSTTAGFYVVTVTGTNSSGSPSHSATVLVHVGDFTISVSTPVNFNGGATAASISVSLTSTFNFVGSVSLSSVVSPTTALTVTCPTIATSLAANATASASCSLGSATPGTFEVTIIGTGSPGTASHSAISVVHAGDFTVSAGSASFNSGASGASIAVSLTSTFNFAGSITLSSAVTPTTGLTVTCLATAVSIAANATVSTSCTLSSTAPGTYLVTITGAGSPGTASHSVNATVHVGDFTISAGTPVNFNSGATGAAISVSLTSVNNFAGSIALSSVVSPTTGLRVTCPATAVSIAANATVSASCTLSSTTAGTYLVTISGAGSPGTASHSALSVVHVGNFAISLGTPVNFNSGASGAAVSVSLASTFNFAGSVSLSSVVSPTTGLTVTCPAAATSLAANVTASASCALSSVTPGTYLVTITVAGSPGTTSHSASAVAHVGGFTISASSAVSFNTGATGASISVSLTSTVNFAGSVTLTSVVSPTTGLTVSCPASAVTLTANATIPASCSLSSTTPATYLGTITGAASPGTASHAANSIVHVGDFSVSVGTPVNFNSGTTSATVSVSLTSVNNFAGTIALSSIASPITGLTVTCPATALSITANSTVSSSCSLSSTTAGTYLVTAAGAGSPGTADHASSSVVHVGDFSIVVIGHSLTVSQTGVSVNVTLTSKFNYAGSVTLTGSARPAGLTVTCPPTAVVLSANATTTVNCSLSSTTPGSYSVTVEGSGTPGTASHSLDAAPIILVAAQPVAEQPFLTGTSIALIGGVLAAVILVALALVLRRRRSIRAA